LVAGDTNEVRDVFLRDLQTRTTTLVSVNRFGSAGGNNRSTEPVISPDGRFIAFISDASDLVANDTNATTDVFVRDLHTGVTTLVSINSAGTDAGNAQSGYMLGISGHKLSADGRFVLFMSDASDLVPNDSNGLKDVFVHDLQTRTTTLVSINRFGTNSADKAPSRPDISADGRFVVFDSQATDLLLNDTNGKSDVFVRDLQTGTTTLVSVNRFGTNGGDDDSIQAQLSANGRFVAFWSSATDLVANQTGRYNVFVRDLQTRTTLQVPVPGDVYDAPKLSANGRFVVVKILGDRGTYELFVHDLQTATSALVSANIAGARSGNYIDDFDISADGRFVVFDALSGGALTTIPATYGTGNVYVRPVQ
jgi:Tol biopolymer transport system component